MISFYFIMFVIPLLIVAGTVYLATLEKRSGDG